MRTSTFGRGAVEHVEATADGFEVAPTDAAPVRAHAIVLAHGLRYDPPPLPGIEPLWGRSVFHCAFCDGWEVRDRPLALHGSGPGAVRSALVLAGWSNDVVLCTDGAPDPGGALLAAAGVRVRTEPIARLAGHDGRLTRIEFSHGPAERREALFVNTRRDQPNGLAAALGCEMTDAGTIVTDDDGRTNVAARVRRRGRGDRVLAVGGERDRHRIARRVRGRARPLRDGGRRGRLTAGGLPPASLAEAGGTRNGRAPKAPASRGSPQQNCPTLATRCRRFRSTASLAELHFGVMVAVDAVERGRRAQRLGIVEATFDPLPIDTPVAREWGRLAAAIADRGGRPRRRAIDLAIAAATANVAGVPLVTHNAADFQLIDDLLDVRTP